VISTSRVRPHQYDVDHADSVASGEAPAEAVRRISGDAERHDGRAPLNEATLLTLRERGLEGAALWVAREDDGDVVGFALASADPDATDEPSGEPVDVNLVVAPQARGAGVGRALAEAALEAFPAGEVAAWSHGNHPAAVRLAAALGFDRARDLWVMRRPLADPLPEITAADGVVVRTFRRGQDEDAFLAINAEAFVDHPEQGKMTRADLDARMAEPWFDTEGFFLAVDERAPDGPADEVVESPSLLGFHWTKVHLDQDPPVGEVYVVGISPAAQGRGLGRLLTLTGLHHLRDRGLGEVILYVEADNAPAVAVYSGLGFSHAEADTDVQYLRRG
jgi:mycothiol synthase